MSHSRSLYTLKISFRRKGNNAQDNIRSSAALVNHDFKTVHKAALAVLFLILNCPVFGQWQQLYGPKGGYIRSLLYHNNHVYAAGGVGVLVSEDQGLSWEKRNNGLLSTDAKSLVHLDDYIFVSTDDNVFRTNNNGMFWEIAGRELEGVYVKNLIAVDDVLFAATYLKGIYASFDYGASWLSVSSGFSAKYS